MQKCLGETGGRGGGGGGSSVTFGLKTEAAKTPVSPTPLPTQPLQRCKAQLHASTLGDKFWPSLWGMRTENEEDTTLERHSAGVRGPVRRTELGTVLPRPRTEAPLNKSYSVLALEGHFYRSAHGHGLTPGAGGLRVFLLGSSTVCSHVCPSFNCSETWPSGSLLSTSQTPSPRTYTSVIGPA